MSLFEKTKAAAVKHARDEQAPVQGRACAVQRPEDLFPVDLKPHGVSAKEGCPACRSAEARTSCLLATIRLMYYSRIIKSNLAGGGRSPSERQGTEAA